MDVTREKETITRQELKSKHHIFALHGYTSDPSVLMAVLQLKKIKGKYVWKSVIPAKEGDICEAESILDAIEQISWSDTGFRFEAFEKEDEVKKFLEKWKKLGF